MLGPDGNVALFRKVHDALVPGGRIVIRDHVMSPDRTAPRAGALFAVNMLVGTEEGGTFTLEEIASWLVEAGFERPPDALGERMDGLVEAFRLERRGTAHRKWTPAERLAFERAPPFRDYDRSCGVTSKAGPVRAKGAGGSFGVGPSMPPMRLAAERRGPVPSGRGRILRPTGLLRFLPAAFLAFWLCGWAVGEIVVLVLLLGPAAAPSSRRSGRSSRSASAAFPSPPDPCPCPSSRSWRSGSRSGRGEESPRPGSC